MAEVNYQYIETKGKPIKAWVNNVPWDWKAREQASKLAQMPFIHKHVAIMPDSHLGIGSTIGSVFATKGAVIPSAVGVDIGCGMVASKTDIDASSLPDNLRKVRTAIEKVVPVGRAYHKNDAPENCRRTWRYTPRNVVPRLVDNTLASGFRRIAETVPSLGDQEAKAVEQLGTLGGGNHFIEVCLDESDGVWIMLHSGSRGIGNMLGRHFIALAKRDMEDLFISLPDSDLAYFVESGSSGSVKNFNDYVYCVEWAQNYARLNREIMMEVVLKAVTDALGIEATVVSEAVNCHHNYVERENHFGSNVLVTRKGAVRAREGDLGIIPGSMGAKSYIVRGKGNRDSFASCSHGAGRVMSRTQAKEEFTASDHERATQGVECRKDSGVIDETPGAYKDIDDVMEAQRDLVDVVHTLKQVVCVKG